MTNRVDANGVSVDMTYDALHRLLTRTYPDDGLESFVYDEAGLIHYTNQLDKVTHYGYDEARRKVAETNANGEVTLFTYDPAGDLLTLTDGKEQVTTWTYDIYGLVSNKVDNASTEILRYGYNPNQWLTNRWSAEKGNTIYSYDPVGNLTNVDYPVSSDITLGYDALNRLTNMVDGVGATVYSYTASGQLESENGPWASDTVTYAYDNRLRGSMSLLQPNATAWYQTYGYDGAKRLTDLASPAGSFGYDYESPRHLLVDKLTLPNGAYITNNYDSVTRLLFTRLNKSSGSTINSHAYGYNAGNQRTQQVFTAGNTVDYTYDDIGQLKTAFGEESGGATRWHEKLSYVYDAAGNLNYRTNAALVQTFAVDSLNQLDYTKRTGKLTVAGTTTSPATNVTVNGSTATRYADNTFASTNHSLSQSQSFTAIAQDSYGRTDTDSISVSHPLQPKYEYDQNGNLLSEHNLSGATNRIFSYDDENQLISVLVTNAWKSEFEYDGKMRRRIRKEYTWSGSDWILTNEVHYVYDGNLVLQERDGDNIPTVTYTRGRDLSGRLEGAGGIGGLLARTDNSQLITHNSQLAHAYYHTDGSGNVTCLIWSNELIAARYHYDPFGTMLALAGPLAEANLYRFSSKEYHPNSQLVYYLYRYYEPNLQRWPNRDPIGELGGLNLYGYVGNDPLDRIDPYGLFAPAPAPLPVLIGGGGGVGGGVAVGGGVLVGGVVVAGAATAGLVGYDLYLMNQINQLNQQNRQAEKCYNQKKKDYEDYKDKCKDIDPPPGQTPCEYARWQLQRKLGCKKGREDFTDKYYGGGYDWGHQRYMDRLNSEIGALQDFIRDNCP